MNLEPEGSLTPLAVADWNFDVVPEEEWVACCYWEYARESAFIRDVKRRCIDPRWKKMTNSQLWEHCGYDLERIQSIGYASEVFLRGFFFDEDEDCKSGHADAPPITGSYPQPWQALSATERRCRAQFRSEADAFGVMPFDLAHWDWAKDLAQHVESQARIMRKDLPPSEGLKPIRPGLCISTAETLLVDIAWSSFTNDQIARAFRARLKTIRPQHLPEPDGRGHKPGDWRAHLTRLAVMRLLARFTSLELVARAKLPAVWKTRQFSAQKWGDITKWHDARREAGTRFHLLFPFLPGGEKPLSWQRRRPAK